MKPYAVTGRALAVIAVATWLHAAHAAEYRWTDTAGAHVVTFAKTAADDQLHLRVTATLNGAPDWTVRDDVTDCAEDKVLDVVPASVETRELLGNGRKQFLFAYRIGCRGDISPDAVKYFLIEQRTKYVLRGEEMLTRRGVRFDGGAPPVPNADLKAAPVLLRYMLQHWRGVSVRNYD
ncbi:DUF4124 domain-containing protein [Burkholderia sp. SIMBA_043]|uniref:DUF4124 domain-containing protein n=1 Tax=Burkholderia vietnamiensis TaxID=60552 RepID=A0AAW7T7S1_BURVI|nr:hypothetical protein [Burkholderia vietnamiensis]AJY05674.1 hypothetical protein AK36_2183 [Burkholderia vietnamiensis LMG 10929]AVR17333.1 hypothetical protein A8H33_29360 [Burkholderia vietnamiensis]KKI40747.1 hypothetical protein VI03_01285 [Burkholderia vietnamiensis]KVM43081.1 hypothetical protein WJ57_28090 [Burkholderia vietnamiensis]KVS06386.1 hypothetical protein WK30_00765 [Burkholderia vietnamiensis]